METFIIIVLVLHYVIPGLSLLTDKERSFEVAAISYIITLVGLYVLVCIMPERAILAGWLKVSTTVFWCFGINSLRKDDNDDKGPGCVTLIPAIIGTIIWIFAL